MPQTRFVLQKGVGAQPPRDHRGQQDGQAGRAAQRRRATRCWSYLLELDATDEQLDSPIVYCSGREGTATVDPNQPGSGLKAAVRYDIEATFRRRRGTRTRRLQMLVSSIDYNEYVGRIAVGRIERGVIRQGQEVSLCDYHAEDFVPRTAR